MNLKQTGQNPYNGNAPFAKCAQTLTDVNAKEKPAKKCGSLQQETATASLIEKEKTQYFILATTRSLNLHCA